MCSRNRTLEGQRRGYRSGCHQLAAPAAVEARKRSENGALVHLLPFTTSARKGSNVLLSRWGPRSKKKTKTKSCTAKISSVVGPLRVYLSSVSAEIGGGGRRRRGVVLCHGAQVTAESGQPHFRSPLLSLSRQPSGPAAANWRSSFDRTGGRKVAGRIMETNGPGIRRPRRRRWWWWFRYPAADA